jgi:hypothetical protein
LITCGWVKIANTFKNSSCLGTNLMFVGNETYHLQEVTLEKEN